MLLKNFFVILSSILSIICFTSVTATEQIIVEKLPNRSQDSIRNDIPYNKNLKLISGDGETLCTGTPISQKHVITAANCVTNLDKNDIFAVITVIKIDKTVQVHYKIQELFIHPNYVTGELYNNIAIVKLVKNFDSYVRPVEIDTKDLSSDCLWNGWKTIHNDKIFYDIDAIAEVYSNSRNNMECIEFFADYFPFPNKDMICAKAPFLDQYCPFNSGMGLICRGKLSGVAAYAQCSDKLAAMAFVNVNTHREWITSLIGGYKSNDNYLRFRRNEEATTTSATPTEGPTGTTGITGITGITGTTTIISTSEPANQSTHLDTTAASPSTQTIHQQPTPCFISDQNDVLPIPQYYDSVEEAASSARLALKTVSFLQNLFLIYFIFSIL